MAVSSSAVFCGAARLNAMRLSQVAHALGKLSRGLLLLLTPLLMLIIVAVRSQLALELRLLTGKMKIFLGAAHFIPSKYGL